MLDLNNCTMSSVVTHAMAMVSVDGFLLSLHMRVMYPSARWCSMVVLYPCCWQTRFHLAMACSSTVSTLVSLILMPLVCRSFP